MFCYLVRHGQDDESVRGGWSDQPLTGEGILQAQALTEKLVGLSIHHVYSSDLPRAMETAQILADKLTLQVTHLPEFREVNNGELAGMKNDIALARYPGLFWNQLNWEQHYPGGESPRQFYERIDRGWNDFSAKILSENKNVLLVTHGGVIHVLLDLIENKRYSNKDNHRRVEYTQMITLTYGDGIWKEQISERDANGTQVL